MLLLLGLALLAVACSGSLREWVEESISRVRLLELLLGFCLVYVAFLVHDVRGLRQRNLVLMETMLAAFRDNQVARRDVDAIDILVAALRATSDDTRAVARRQLRRLTGMDHGEDAEAWERWWESQREGWAGPPRGAS